MSRLGRLFRRGRLERHLDAELTDHLERQVADYRSAGLSEDEARRQASLAFGSTESVKEACRDARGTRWLEDAAVDVRYALRYQRKHPAFAVVAALSLGLGIGATAAIFSLADAVLLRPLPVRAPHELVLLGERVDGRHILSWSTDQFRTLQQSETLTGLCAFRPQMEFAITGNGVAQLAQGQLLSGNCFDVLGIRAHLGRLLTEEDDRSGGGGPVAVVSYQFWRRHFASDPAVVGRPLAFGDRVVTVVGVTPREFYGLEPGRAIDVSIPLSLQPWVLPGPLSSPHVRWLRLIGRRRADVSMAQAEADLARQWRPLVPPRADAPGSRFELLRGAQGLNDLRQQYSSPLRLLMAAVAALLLMACANLASLILARTRAREHEVALRLAVGASRGRVARQLLTEALVLAAVGGAVGLAVAYWGSHAIITLLSRGRSPILLDLGVDARLLGFTAVLSVLTSLLFGIWPAWTAVRSNGHPGLLTGERAAARTNRVSVLVAIQSALSVVLLISAMLFARTLLNLHRVDTGLDKRQVLLVRVRSGAAASAASASRFHEELQTRLAGRPGVRSVTRSMDIPFGGSSYRASVAVPGEAVREDEQVNYNFVGPGFFETMGIALASGRDFEPADDSTSRPVAVISQSLAQRYFPGRDAVGSHLVAGKAIVEIVGVARDISYAGVREEKELVIYRPLLQDARANAGGIFAIRADLPPAAIADLVRQTLRETAPDVAISSMTTLEAQFDGSIATERLMASIAGFFAVTALLLVAVGVYGTLASLVVRRTRELGIRLALGASRRSIARLVLGGALSPVALGLLLGLPIALAGVRLARSVLFGITPSDPVTYLGGAIVLVVVAAAAAALPALSATRADPMAALRQE